ncbi:MAG: Ig domain-containing protein [Candidatus Neomarinimicrobiota bacterium]
MERAVSRLAVLLSVLVLTLGGANLKVVHIDGIFDLDYDDLVEFLTIEDGQGTGGVVTRIGYYEIDELGFPQLLWNIDAPRDIDGSIVHVRMADMDGSGTPEIVVAANARGGIDGELDLATLYLFEWDQGEFPEEPTLTLSLADTIAPQAINNLDLLDLEGDGRDELVLSLLGTEPTLSIIALSTIDNVRQLHERWSYVPEGFSSSGGRLYVGSLDFDRNGQYDLFALSPERNVLRIQSFLNQGGILKPGPGLLRRVPGMSDLHFRSFVKLDWNRDSRDDLLIPFRSGHVVSLSFVEGRVEVSELGIDAGPLSNLTRADFNQDGLPDLLLVSPQQGVVTLAYGTPDGGAPLQEFFSIAAGEEEPGIQIFCAVPEIVDGIYLGTVIAGGWTGDESEIFYFELGSVPEYPEEEILVDTYIPEARVEEAVEELPRARPMEGKPLPPGILPTYVLPVNQTFAYTIPEDEEREFFSFRWLEPPARGMYFHYDTRSIEWVPDDQQLGAYELSYHLRMKVGETIDIMTDEDTVVTYQVVPELASLESRFWIYVNDPPKITSFPEGTEFVAGSRFAYNVVAIDKNEDVHLRYTLEKAPEGMSVDEDGFVSWQTDASHIDIYPVRIVVSDGFDRDVQTFRLYSRGQVVITSYPEEEAAAGEKYTYELKVTIPEDKREELIFALLKAPYGMSVDNTGLITWTPQSTQIDTQRFVVSANHGIAADTQRVSVYVNHSPVLVSVPEAMTKIAIEDTFNFQLVVEDPNEFDILRYEPVSLPPGMRVDPSTGRILWVPAEENLDFSTAVVNITDGHENIELSFELFVNSPIHITSEPTTLATVGKPYNYKIIAADLNRGSLMTFSHVTPVYDLENSRVYSVQIEDDVYRENIQRYVGEFMNKKSILVEIQEKGPDGEETVSRVNLRKHVQSVFYEDERLLVIIRDIGGRKVKIKDVLWEFFEGNKGKPPKVLVERAPFVHYALLDFPDGMFVDELTGAISWTPSLKQYDTHTVTFMVSDGYTRDEQSFDLYVNHPPTIISTAPRTARVDQLYKYKVVVEDKNSDKQLTYRLLKAPKGMQIGRDGRITWMPKPSQINSRLFGVGVSDGYEEDLQETNLFVNIAPQVISEPKPVALTNFEYRYRMATEDLNGDQVRLRAIKTPKYAKFDEQTGMFRWKPRMNQRGVNNIVLSAVDERGLATSHEFQIHVFEDPSAQQFVSTSWPLLLAFVGTMFTVGMSALR